MKNPIPLLLLCLSTIFVSENLNAQELKTSAIELLNKKEKPKQKGDFEIGLRYDFYPQHDHRVLSLLFKAKLKENLFLRSSIQKPMYDHWEYGDGNFSDLLFLSGSLGIEKRIKTRSRFQFYYGAEIGLSTYNLKNSYGYKSKTRGLSLAAIGGLMYQMNKRLSIYAEFRPTYQFDFQKRSSPNFTDRKYTRNYFLFPVSLGTSYSFGKKKKSKEPKQF